MTAKTALRIFKGGVEIPLPPGSSRWLDWTMEPIAEAAQIERAVDGSAVNLGYEGFQVYSVFLACNDMRVPAIAGIWPGDVLTIYSPESLIEPGPSVMLSREPVPGSVRAYDVAGKLLGSPEPDGRLVSMQGAAYFEYLPILSVMVTGFSRSKREMRASSSWSLSAVETDPASAAPVVQMSPRELVQATGGDLVYDYADDDGANWRVHEFLSTQALSVTADGDAEFVMEAGGGGTGRGGGGGGAGGFLRFWKKLEVGSHTMQVGAGGAAGTDNQNRTGFRGSDSICMGVRAFGGGGGRGANDQDQSRKNGGCGGGQYQTFDGPGTGIEYQGHDGGRGVPGSSWGESGGGGGIGGPGQQFAANIGGVGGSGILIEDFFDTPRWMGSGGSAGPDRVPGGGGGGGTSQANGDPNTGGGGAGNEGNGGSGIIAIRYRIA